MNVIGPCVCAAAAFRLASTPLFVPALVVAALDVLAVGVGRITRSQPGAPRRLITATGHVAAALGGFFLFASFSLP